MEAWVAALVPEIEKAVHELEPVEDIKAAIDDARYRAKHAAAWPSPQDRG